MEKIRKFLKSISTGIAVSAAFSFMLTVYAPIELYVSSQKDFWFTLSQLLPFIVLFFFLLTVLLSAAFAGLRAWGRTPYRIGVAVLGGTFLGLYIQGNFLVSNLPVLDGTAVDWNAYPIERIKSIAVFVILAAIIVFAFLKLKFKVFKKAVLVVSGAVSLILIITLTTLLLTTEFIEKDGYLAPTNYNDFQYSTDENVIVFVVDALGSPEFQAALENNPEFKDTFDDFVYYDDALAGYPYTLHSLPLMFSGEWYENEEPFHDYSNRVLENSDFINELVESNYKIGFYNDGELLFRKSKFEGVFENQVNLGSKFSSPLSTFMLVAKMSAVKYAPWDLKFFGYNVAEHAADCRKFNASEEYGNVKVKNTEFYGALKDSNPITVTEDKCARIIHIEGAHVPYQYNKEMETVTDGDYNDMVEACLTICDQYLRRLKESGVYDNSAIVILADHGHDATYTDYALRMNPVLMVKGIGDKREEMEINKTPVSYVDLSKALTRLVKGTPANEIFDGFTYENGRRYIKYAAGKEEFMWEFIAHGKAYEADKMEETGKELHYNK